MSGPYFWVAIVCLLGLLAGTLISAGRTENQTIDENVHIAAGYSYLKTRDFRMNPEHPPLGKLICGLPLLFLNPSLPLQSTYWKLDQQHQFGREFLYHNKVSADTLLFFGRLGTVAITVGFGLFLAVWVRRWFGSTAAIFSLALFAFDANILAHGKYITTDMAVTAFVFIACVMWAEFLYAPSRRLLIVFGLVLGLALDSKYSAFMLFPILLAIYVFAVLQGRSGLTFWRMARSFAGACAIAFLVIFISYGAVVKPLVSDALVADRLHVSLDASSGDRVSPPPDRQVSSPPSGQAKVQPLASSLRLGGLGRRAINWVATVPLPAHYYLIGFYKIAEHSFTGQSAYLLGKYSQNGWWYFFPVAFLVKTPVALLLLLLLGTVAGVRWLITEGRHRERWRELPPVYGALVIAPLGWLLLSCCSTINIGLRHILPIYPFLYVLVAAVVFAGGRNIRARSLLVAAAAIAILAVESWHVYPHYVAFFNAFVGGPANGPRYLLDSNVDWGQDLKNLKEYTDRHGGERVCLSYWGIPDPEYYHLSYQPLPEIRTPQELGSIDCLAAVSVELLFDEEGHYQALRDRRPDDQVGYSIYLYDLRKSRSGALSETLEDTDHQRKQSP